MSKLALALLVVIAVPAATAGYIILAEKLAGLLPERRRQAIRPWLWLGPALVLLFVLLVYPTLRTFYLSLLNARSTEFVGLANYVFVLTDGSILEAIRNNVIWLVVFTPVVVTLGLVVAVLADRVSYESAIKAVIFLPMAISFVAAGVIWKFMYNYRPPSVPQTGTLNAVITLVPGVDPIAWLINSPWNNLALIAVAVWTWVGFCMVILSAALKGVAPELLEAARVDGATELQIFRQIIIPLISPTIAVVATTMIIFALKAFDIVYIMTNGAFGTEVIANRMYKEMFNFRDFGRASAVAVVLLLAIIPVMVVNVRRFRQQEDIR